MMSPTDSEHTNGVPSETITAFLNAARDTYADTSATRFHSDGSVTITLTHTHQGAFKSVSTLARRFGIIPDGNREAGGQHFRHIAGTSPTLDGEYHPNRYNVVMVGNPNYIGDLPYDPDPVESALEPADALDAVQDARENLRDDVEYRVQSCDSQELIAVVDEDTITDNEEHSGDSPEPATDGGEDRDLSERAQKLETYLNCDHDGGNRRNSRCWKCGLDMGHWNKPESLFSEDVVREVQGGEGAGEDPEVRTDGGEDVTEDVDTIPPEELDDARASTVQRFRDHGMVPDGYVHPNETEDGELKAVDIPEDGNPSHIHAANLPEDVTVFREKIAGCISMALGDTVETTLVEAASIGGLKYEKVADIARSIGLDVDAMNASGLGVADSPEDIQRREPDSVQERFCDECDGVVMMDRYRGERGGVPLESFVCQRCGGHGIKWRMTPTAIHTGILLEPDERDERLRALREQGVSPQVSER